MSALAAYFLAVFVIGGVVGLVVAILEAPIMVAMSRSLGTQRASWASLAFGALTAAGIYALGQQAFAWLGVHFAWYSYLACMIAPVLNDGRRAGAEPADRWLEKMHATGMLLGMVGSLVRHAIG